jgi:hypothetical protein
MVAFYQTPFGHIEVRIDRRPQRPVTRPAERRPR